MTDSAPANPFWMTLYVVVVFVAVAALAVYALRFMSRRWTGASRTRHMRVIEQLYLGPNRMVCLVAVPGKVLVIGVAERSVDVLSVIDDPDIVAALQPAPDSGPLAEGSFAARLRQLLGRQSGDSADHEQVDETVPLDYAAADFRQGERSATGNDVLLSGIARLRKLHSQGVGE